ncbi:sporulation protein YunB [Clostridium tetanomorphum]|nr:sporulation protein YunB [Clostridium tetanomorphum]SQC02488.1 sporulation protein YunB [Clostridium tetanomorphum]
MKIIIRDFKFKMVLIFLFLSIFGAIFIYTFDEIVTPTVITVADGEMRAKALEILNKTIIDNCLENFKYEDIISMEKDDSGNIAMIKADTLKMNKIACDVALESQQRLKDLGTVGIKMPLGYVFKNNILAYFGPNITVKMQPIGYIETKYLSDFESAGINQTRHKIYVQVKTNIRVIIPMRSNDIEVKNEIPISETIIVGRIPETSINLGLENAGFKIRAEENMSK